MGAPNSSTTAQSANANANANDRTFLSVPNDMNNLHSNDRESDSNNNDSDDDPTRQTYLSLIQQYLQVFQIDNALFLAERCVAEYPNCTQAVYLQALCHYRKGKPQTARHILDACACSSASLSSSSSQQQQQQQQQQNPQMQYLAAQCSVELQEWAQAEQVLLKEPRMGFKQHQAAAAVAAASTNANAAAAAAAASNTQNTTMEDWIVRTSPCPVPNGAAGLALLGKIYQKSHRKERAIQYYKMSLQLDPFLFTSFQALADMGEHDLDAATVFGVPSNTPSVGTNTNTAAAVTTPAPAALPVVLGTKTPLQPSTTIATTTAARTPAVPRTILETPGLTPISSDNNTMLMTETPVVRRARQVASRQYYPPSPDTPMTNVTRSMRYLHGLSGIMMDTSAMSTSSIVNQPLLPPQPQQQRSDDNQARSLFWSTHENQVTAPPESSSNINSNADEEDSLQKPEKQQEQRNDAAAVHDILQLLSVAGTAYQQLCQYDCRRALQTLRMLPIRQQNTAWTLHMQGRAYLELSDFGAAQRSLERMHQIAPGRMAGLELLSTVYWQLKHEVALASLAQQVVDWDKLAPEAWCVVGNCFSLQKDHDTALRFFQRALQLRPDWSYPHTLSGYEYMANEDFDQALQCFRQALRTSHDRQCNAWYGLGGIYHRQEKYDLAEYHFARACDIHPASSILRCHLGMAQYANGKAYQALETLGSAASGENNNPQARFQRATIYTALHRPQEALKELEKVRDVAPREATVYLAMGKVLKKLGRIDEAMKCFLMAMDLDPKDSQMIKSAMDKLDEPEVDEETMTPF